MVRAHSLPWEFSGKRPWEQAGGRGRKEGSRVMGRGYTQAVDEGQRRQ